MKWTAVLLLGACAVAVYRTLAGESMQKQKPMDRVSPRWIVQHAYDRTGDES